MVRTPNDLPEPVTVQEMYLAAILAELRALHVLLTPTQTARKHPEVKAPLDTQYPAGKRKRS